MKSFVEQRHAATNSSRHPDRVVHNLNNFKVDKNGNAPVANTSVKHPVPGAQNNHPSPFETDGSAADDTSNGANTGREQQTRRDAEPQPDDLLQSRPQLVSSKEPDTNEGGEEFSMSGFASLTAASTRLDKKYRESLNGQDLTWKYLRGDSYPTTSSEQLSQDALSRMDRGEVHTRQTDIEEWRQGDKGHILTTRGPSSPPLSIRDLQYQSPSPWLTRAPNPKSGVADRIELPSPGHTVMEHVAIDPGKSRRVHRRPKQPELGADDWLANIAQAGPVHSTSREGMGRIAASDLLELPGKRIPPDEDEIGTSSTITGQQSPTPRASRAGRRSRPEKHRESSPGLLPCTKSTVSDSANTDGIVYGDKNRLMDYDMETLGTMDYNAIKSANFDRDPSVKQLTLPGLSDNASLADKMIAASGLRPELQAEFFATLDIEAWENAGGWFVDHFGEILSRLKNARQEKRKCARAFEGEIEHRHVVVTKRLKMTDSVFADMKQNGVKVLQCTPKRAAEGKGVDG